MGSQDLKDTIVELKNGKVEGAAAQVVDRDLGVLLELVETVGERRRRRLVDDALDLESGQFSGAQGGVSLGVIEIGRNGNDRTIYGLSQRQFRIPFELLQHLGSHLFRAPNLASDVEAGRAVLGALDGVGDSEVFGGEHRAAPTHEPLGGVQGALGVQNAHPIGGLSYQRVSAVGRNMDH